MKQTTKSTTDKNIIIPIQMEQLKTWTRRTLEATTWVISLGLLAASAAVAGGAFLVWLLFRSETILVLGCAGGLALGLAGVWHLLQRLERMVKQLKPQTPGTT